MNQLVHLTRESSRFKFGFSSAQRGSNRDDQGCRVDRFYDIEIDVTAEGILVKADGEERGVLKSDSSLTAGEFSVGPAFGSVITFEKLEVVDLDED